MQGDKVGWEDIDIYTMSARNMPGVVTWETPSVWPKDVPSDPSFSRFNWDRIQTVPRVTAYHPGKRHFHLPWV